MAVNISTAKAEQEARAKAEQEARAKAEQEARAKAEQKASVNATPDEATFNGVDPVLSNLANEISEMEKKILGKLEYLIKQKVNATPNRVQMANKVYKPKDKQKFNTQLKSKN